MKPLLSLLAVVLLGSPALADAKRPPNFVIVYADDLGYGDLGCFGNTTIRTPNLDQMADDGIRFTDFYVAQAVCSASRTALLTGCYPNRLGILGAGPASKNGINDRETTIAQMLKTQGLRHRDLRQMASRPSSAVFADPARLRRLLRPALLERHVAEPPDCQVPRSAVDRGEKTIEKNPDQHKLTTWYTERAVGFIEKNKDKPFFLYVPHNMPHVPLVVSDKHQGKSKGGLYGDVIEEIDWSVGAILAALKKHNLDENTLVIFTSDNGPWLSYGAHAGIAGPLREGKGTSFEGGVREPFIARWTGTIPAGKVCTEPAMTIDILPTFAAPAGAELPKLPIDGKDISALLLAKENAKSPQRLTSFTGTAACRPSAPGNGSCTFRTTIAP